MANAAPIRYANSGLTELFLFFLFFIVPGVATKSFWVEMQEGIDLSDFIPDECPERYLYVCQRVEYGATLSCIKLVEFEDLIECCSFHELVGSPFGRVVGSRFSEWV